MSRIRDDRGLTLVELLVTATLSIVMLSATLTAFTAMQRQQARTARMNDQQQVVRTTLDRMARQLRNLASPTQLVTKVGDSWVSAELPRSVERDGPNDLVFQDVDQVMPAGSLNSANVRRVRYCLDPTTPADGTLWMQSQTWTTAVAPETPADTACPGSGWTTSTRVATGVTNANATPARPVFRYSGDAGAITATDAGARARIERIEATVFVDPDVTRPPYETSLTTSVFLRNQNREPQAQFALTVLNPLTRTIQLNGSASQDPEGKPLTTYKWVVDGVESKTLGIVVQLTLTAGTHTISLRAYDPSGLMGESAPQQVTL